MKHWRRTRSVTLHAWILGIVCFLLSQPLGGGSTALRSFFIPLIGHGQGFSTEINLINLSPATSQVQINTFDDDGDPLRLLRQNAGLIGPPESVSELIVDIPGTGTAHALTLNPDPGQLDVGWAQVSTQHAVGVQFVFRILDNDNLVTAADIRVGHIVTAASFLGLVDLAGGIDTGLALVNPPQNPEVEVTIEAIGSAGDVALTTTINLQPGGKVSQFLFQFLPELGDFKGSIELRSSDPADPDNPIKPPIAILPIRQEGLVLTTQNVFPPRQRP